MTEVKVYKSDNVKIHITIFDKDKKKVYDHEH